MHEVNSKLSEEKHNFMVVILHHHRPVVNQMMRKDLKEERQKVWQELEIGAYQ